MNDWNLRVLGVQYNPQFNSYAGIRNVALMRENFDIDYVDYVSNPDVYRKLVRESIYRLGSVMWPSIAGQTAFVVQVAVRKQIPLVVWPYHQPTEQVGQFSYREANEMTRLSRHAHDLIGVEASDLIRPQSLVTEKDVFDLQYPTDQALLGSGVRGVYLSNFYPWDSRLVAEAAVDRWGALCARSYRTFDTYDRIETPVYMGPHDLLKEAKLGYGRVTDSLCREIRFGRIDKEDARLVAAHFSSQYPTESVKVLCEWLGLSRTQSFDWLLARWSQRRAHLDDWTFGPTPGSSDAIPTRIRDFIRGFKINCDLSEDPSYYLYMKALQ